MRERKETEKYLWLFAVWPILIVISLPLIAYPGSGTLYHILLVLSGTAAGLMLFSTHRRRERGYTGGIIAAIAALAVAISATGIEMLYAIGLFTILITSNELTLHAIRIHRAEAGTGVERELVMREFLRGPGINIVKTGAVVLLISAGILLLAPAVALWTSSIYAVMILAVVAGLSGYYMLTRR